MYKFDHSPIVMFVEMFSVALGLILGIGVGLISVVSIGKFVLGGS